MPGSSQVLQTPAAIKSGTEEGSQVLFGTKYFDMVDQNTMRTCGVKQFLVRGKKSDVTTADDEKKIALSPILATNIASKRKNM